MPIHLATIVGIEQEDAAVVLFYLEQHSVTTESPAMPSSEVNLQVGTMCWMAGIGLNLGDDPIFPRLS